MRIVLVLIFLLIIILVEAVPPLPVKRFRRSDDFYADYFYYAAADAYPLVQDYYIDKDDQRKKKVDPLRPDFLYSTESGPRVVEFYGWFLFVVVLFRQN